MDDACPTCGDRLNHAGLPTAQSQCATRVHLIEGLQTYAESIDGADITGIRFVDLLAAVENRCDRDLFTAARICEAIIGLGWRPKDGAS